MAVIKMNFLSKALGMQTNVTVCLPSYAFGPKRTDYVPGMKFQVLWLLHGGSGDDSDYVNFTNIVRYADENRIAVVMPADYNAMYIDDPIGAKYYTYIVEELPEMCAAYFPFSTAREDNFVAGLSMGGAGAFKCAMANPEKYAAALCMSGVGIDTEELARQRAEADNKPMGDINIRPFEIVPGSRDDAWLLARTNKENGIDVPKMFLSVGDKDFGVAGIRKCRDYLIGLGYDIFYEEEPGYGHEWDLWDLTLRKALREWLPIRHDAIYPDAE